MNVPSSFGIAAVGTVFLLSACMVGPNYTKPTVPVPPGFKEAKGWKVARPSDNAARGPWWEVFGDPVLSELQKRLVITNQNVAAAEAQFRQSRALVRGAKAQLYPTVKVEASAKRIHIGEHGVNHVSETEPDFLLLGDVSWEPDFWGGIRRNVESNHAAAEASAAQLEGARLSAHAELATDYFQLRALDAQKIILDEAAVFYRDFLELARSRQASGAVSIADVLQAETQFNAARARQIDIGIQRAQTEHAIALLVGVPASDFSIPPAPIAAAPPDIPVGVPSELLERRPDVASAERLMASANAKIGVAEAAFFPTVTLSATGGFDHTNFLRWLSWPSHFWSLGSSVAETLFSGGLRRAEAEQARAAYDASVASYRQTVLTAFKEVEDSLAELRILEEEARIQDEAVKAGERSLAVTLDQYKAGTAGYLHVVVVQSALLDGKKSALDVLSRRLGTSVSLVKAMGGDGYRPPRDPRHPGGGEHPPAGPGPAPAPSASKD